MGLILKNGIKLIDCDLFLKEYGCIKIEYREHENGLYYLYAFKNDLPVWDFLKGELILITHDKSLINAIKEKILTFELTDNYCKECFKKKDIHSLSANDEHWGYFFWKHTPEEARIQLQNEILFNFPEITWPMVWYITDYKDAPAIPYGVGCKKCMPKESFEKNNAIKQYRHSFQSIWESVIADELIKGNEKLLEHYLCDYIETIEDGMVFEERQYKVDNGIIDIVAKDKNGVKCIIELKISDDDKNIIWQSAYYPTCFQEKVRMITIAPNYSSKIYNALKNVNEVEMKVFRKNETGRLEIKDFEVKRDLKKQLDLKICSNTTEHSERVV